MKYRIALLASFLLTVNVSYADGDSFQYAPKNHFAVQAAITTNGNIGVGIANYAETYEYGLTLSALINNRGTHFVVPVIFAGFRKGLAENTYLAYGLDLGSKFGKINSSSVNANIFVGPYVGIEQMLSHHVMLTGWINPYSFEYEKISGVSTSTNRILSSGGFGINYLFD